jgi:hypothetical protein
MTNNYRYFLWTNMEYIAFTYKDQYEKLCNFCFINSFHILFITQSETIVIMKVTLEKHMEIF